MSYLVDQYGKNDRLNPHTPNERALVNQRLYFDIGTLYKAVKYYYVSIHVLVYYISPHFCIWKY